MIKTYTALQTAKIAYKANDSLSLVAGTSYTLDDSLGDKFPLYLQESNTWKTLEEDIAVNLTDVIKTYTFENIKGKKYITLTLTPTGTIPTAMVILATLKNKKGQTVDTTTLTTSTTYAIAKTFNFKLNRPFENNTLSISITFKAGTAYSVDVTADDLTDTALNGFEYKNSTSSWVQTISPNLS